VDLTGWRRAATMGRMAPFALFDLDDTLVDRKGTYRRWAESFAAGRALDSEAVEWLCEADNDGFAVRRDLFADAVVRFGLTDPVDDLLAAYWDGYLGVYRPDPEVSGALGRLRETGWKIAIVTNGPPTQHEKVARSGLADLVDVCCVSSEVGVSKPDQRIFEEAFRRLGCSPAGAERGWMVGDAPGPDIGGGREAGLQTIWMHRGRNWGEEGFRPEVEVATVPEAVEVMLSW
jgi:FMN phosphatase YigB (HAD superfamily)